MRVGFTGTRQGMTPGQRQVVGINLSQLMSVDGLWQFHSGDCVGADSEAYDLAVGLDFMMIGYIPVDEKYRAFREYDEVRDPKTYLERNRDIVNETELLIVAPSQMREVMRSGTWMTYRYAKGKHKPIIVCFPDGSVSRVAGR